MIYQLPETTLDLINAAFKAKAPPPTIIGQLQDVLDVLACKVDDAARDALLPTPNASNWRSGNMTHTPRTRIG